MAGDTPSFLLPGDPLLFDKRQTATDRLPRLFNRRRLVGLCGRGEQESDDNQRAEVAGYEENLGRLIECDNWRSFYTSRGPK